MKDIEVTIRIRNGRLVDALEKAMKELQCDTIKSFFEMMFPEYKSNAMHVNYMRLASFKISPWTKRGEWRIIVKKLCGALCENPEDLFDQDLYDGSIVCNTAKRYLSKEGLAALIANDIGGIIPAEIKSADDIITEKRLEQQVKKLIETLDPREEYIFRKLHGFEQEELGYDEIGQKLNLAGENIRQIEKMALKRLRHPRKSCLLRPYFES